MNDWSDEFARAMQRRLDRLEAALAQTEEGLTQLWKDYPHLNPYPPPDSRPDPAREDKTISKDRE